MPTEDPKSRAELNKLARMLDRPGFIPQTKDPFLFSFIVRTALANGVSPQDIVAHANTRIDVAILRAVAQGDDVMILPLLCVDIVRNGIRPLLTESGDSVKRLADKEVELLRWTFRDYLAKEISFVNEVETDHGFVQLVNTAVEGCRLDPWQLAEKSPARATVRGGFTSGQDIGGWSRGEGPLLPKKYRVQFFTEAVLPVLEKVLNITD